MAYVLRHSFTVFHILGRSSLKQVLCQDIPFKEDWWHMWDIIGIQHYSACKEFQPGSATQEQASLLQHLWVCCIISTSALFKKNKLKTQKRKKKIACDPKEHKVSWPWGRSVSLDTQSQARPRQHIYLQDYTLLIHHIGCSREAICSHALPRAVRRQYRTSHTISVVSWHQLPITLLT